MRSLVVAAALAATSGAAAQSAHQHGIADLFVVVENATVAVELVSPAADLLGFEHPPRSEAQWRSAKTLIDTLESEASIQAFHTAGVCRRASWRWETELFDAETLALHHVDLGVGHDHEEDHRHDHHHPDDYHQDGHHHDDSAHTGHAEVLVRYTFECPGSPASLDHKLFELFPSLQELRVSVATDDGQRGTRQRRGQSARIDF